MTAVQATETGNTDFAIRKGKLQIRLEWVFRLVLLLLVILTNAGLWLNKRLITREEFNNSASELVRRLDDHESRLRALEHKP